MQACGLSHPRSVGQSAPAVASCSTLYSTANGRSSLPRASCPSFSPRLLPMLPAGALDRNRWSQRREK